MRRRLYSNRLARIISGRERIVTAHAYAVMSIPALASVIWKSAAISTRSPMGINSDVLKMKTLATIPIRGIHSQRAICCFIDISPFYK